MAAAPSRPHPGHKYNSSLRLWQDSRRVCHEPKLSP
jgi:hypothetical protein